MMRTIYAVAILLFMPVSLAAQELNWIDTGKLNHSKHGEGIAIILSAQPFSALPKEEQALSKGARDICDQLAPTAVPFVQEKVEFEALDFIVVEFRSGGAIGSYLRVFFQYKNGGCGEEL